MASSRSRCRPTSGREENSNCVSAMTDRIRKIFSKSSYQSDQQGRKARKQLVNAIECEPLKSGENEQKCQTAYDVETNTYNNIKWFNSLDKGTIIALLLAVLSMSLSYIMWLTNAYDNAVLKLVSIRDDIDMVFDLWRMPPTKAYLSVYLFNYTNHKAVLEGRELPNVQEVGPFVFREKMERINVKFYDNDTVSFQEKRMITFDPERTVGSLHDRIFSPNVPLITTLKQVNQLYFMEQTAMSVYLNVIEAQPFYNVTINESIWGYEDNFFQQLKRVVKLSDKPAPSGFGFLAKRAGIHHDIVTMKTGMDDLSKTGIIIKWNGKDRIGPWENSSCNELQGSDGTLFPADKARHGENLYVYSHSMCRRIPLRFNKTTASSDGFPVQQYNVYEDMFDYDENNQENNCFIYRNKTSPKGVFNTAPCYGGKLPMYVSFPHFWKGGDEVNIISGLKPDAVKHMSYFHIHKDLGISLRVKTRFQVNIALQKSKFIEQFAKVMKDRLILPIGWLDFDSGELPEHFVNTIYHLTYTVKIVKEVLKWILLLCDVICLTFLALQIKKRFS